MTVVSLHALYEVQLDINIARRKRMHSVFDPAGIPVFHAPLVLQVLNWLHEQDIHSVRFTDDETTYDVTFNPPAEQTQAELEAQNG
ncbi:MAG TPA: hypothetical protein ENH89_00180 [Aurantimonas coralicida]|uniref:Uncharacterized protein n=1 Tax=Aurantimonas coralicida TaxID=182270 RepID=A0A9C9NBJ9_9HYPH|nr:hypothetical protein [Aurantimonas coralicida]